MRTPASSFPVVYLDGVYLPAGEARVSVFDRGFLVADGVFETLVVLQGVPLDLPAHLDRLARSARFMEIALPSGSEGLRRVVERMLLLNDLARRSAVPAALRITLTRGAEIGGPPTICLMARRLPTEHLDKREHGVALFRLPLHGRGASDLAEHKTLSHLPSSLGQVWLARLAGDQPAEGLFVNPRGEVLEGTASNLFAVEAGALVTPPISAGILRGTSRRRVLDLAASARVPATEEPLPVARLAAADEVFLTSSTLRVAPAVSLDGVPLGAGGPGPLTRRLQALLEVEVEAEVAAWYASRGGA